VHATAAEQQQGPRPNAAAGVQLGLKTLTITQRRHPLTPLYLTPPRRAQATNVVVKGYSPHVVAGPEDLQVMVAEARNIQRLQHRWAHAREAGAHVRARMQPLGLAKPCLLTL
jgi:hypothetical protein